MHFDLISTPLILGSASLIAFVSVRSASISDRVREANREVIAPGTTPARRHNLMQRQIPVLKRRYLASQYALLFLLLAFIAFVVMATLFGLMYPATSASEIALFAGIGFALIAFALTLYEVAISGSTLTADIEYAESVYRDPSAG